MNASGIRIVEKLFIAVKIGFLKTISGTPTITPPINPPPPRISSIISEAKSRENPPKVANIAVLKVFRNVSSIPKISFFNMPYVNMKPSSIPVKRILNRNP